MAAGTELLAVTSAALQSIQTAEGTYVPEQKDMFMHLHVYIAGTCSYRSHAGHASTLHVN